MQQITVLTPAYPIDRMQTGGYTTENCADAMHERRLVSTNHPKWMANQWNQVGHWLLLSSFG